MIRTTVCLAAAFLAACAPGAKSQGSALCEAGKSALDLVYLQSTGPQARIQSTTLRASILFLAECPASVDASLRDFGEHERELRRAWFQALRAGARDTSSPDTRILLSEARTRVAQARNRSLKVSLDTVFEGLDDRALERGVLAPAIDRQALATLQDYAKCDGVGCFDASDNLLFLLGTYPLSMAKGMHADSTDARKWLRLVADESFTGPPERSKRREAVRGALLAKLSGIKAAGFERELQACENRLGAIRYEPVQ